MVVEIPALIDMHVHFRDPGFEYKETIETGLKSAAAGGFGGVCAMANTKPVCDNVETLKFIQDRAKGFECELYPVCAVTKNLDSDELVNFEELSRAGAVAFSNDGLPILNHNTFYRALKSGALILSHLENETEEASWQIEVYRDLVLNGYSPRLHFCHISKKSTLDLIRNAKAQNLTITCETAPHYFTFTKNDITRTGVFKMNPPLADESDRLAVIEAIKDGTIDVVATDHAPHGTEEKLKPYSEAPNGITGLETAFSLTYGLFGKDKTVELMAVNPRKILGVENNKKVKFDLDKTRVVSAQNFESKCKVSPYEKMELRGVLVND